MEGTPRVVYVGRISHGRGIGTVIALGRALGERARVEIAGPVDHGVGALLEEAVAEETTVEATEVEESAEADKA